MKTEQAGLIAACIQGDETAITQLIQEYQLGVFRVALSVLNDSCEANEVAQDTFISALNALRSYRENTSFKAWLYTIALNASRSRLRKRKTLDRLKNTLTVIFHVQSQHLPTLEDMIVSNEEDTALWKALENLGEKHRIPILLRYYHELSVAEIAEILNIKEGTVHSRLFTGRERLRTELDSLFDDWEIRYV